MHLVIFGLSVTSSWGNGHATLWRGLIRALGRRGARVTFYEKDVPWYRKTRDRNGIEGGTVVLYEDWADVRATAAAELACADAALVTSYCPDGMAASRLVSDAPALRVFYDLDTPVTLAHRARGEPVDYLPPEGLGGFDLVLSYTGGGALEQLRVLLGARRTAPLYGHVDPHVHRPGRPRAAFAGELSYIGTYAADRQAAVERLLVEPARRRPDKRFVIAGAQYPHEFPWTANIHFVRHLPAQDHPDFYASSRLTLNVTRRDMAAFGWCPSGRLFEAAACGATIISDLWPGIADFLAPGEELVGVSATGDVLAALDMSEAERRRIAARARERVLAEHTSERRADELAALLAAVRRPVPAPALEA
ncbi:MAG TPA: glycosyltransferase [Alphaproteobacteria bacterium]|nr:glycosyltransferase [Alphaproteobacteria bacterium]